MYSQEEVLNANRVVHTAAADTYNQTEPHFRAENVTRIEEIIKSLKSRTNGTSLLDIGCGTGFMIDIAKNHFKMIRGIDITPAMLEKVNTNHPGCDIEVSLAGSESMPFDAETFDVCTAHAVLHHLHELMPTIREIHRVLKPGGMFYSDLDPNFHFWEAMSSLPAGHEYNASIKREIEGVLRKEEELAEKYSLDKELFRAAEPLKHVKNGFRPDLLQSMFEQAGFGKTEIHYEWFLGEAPIIHGNHPLRAVELLRSYLKDMLPLTRHLFKYIRIQAVKQDRSVDFPASGKGNRSRTSP